MVRGSGWLVLAALLASVLQAGAATLEHVTFEGWSDCRRISNGIVDLVFVPQVGRIMRYGYVNKPNVLWVNCELAGQFAATTGPGRAWENYGGDKLWPAPQSVWGFPPDSILDGSPWSVRDLVGGRIEAWSPASPVTGIRFRRVISLASTGSQVTVENIMECIGATPVSWGIWEVTQVSTPDWSAVPLGAPGRFPTGYRVFPDTRPAVNTVFVVGSEARMRRHASTPGKIGSDSPRCYARARTSGVTLTLWATRDALATYPDEGCSAEIYGSPDPTPYMELELLGPLQTLTRGQRQKITTHWRLQ